MPRIPWTLVDYSTGEAVNYDLSINPNTFREPGYQPNFTHAVTTAPNGQSIFFKGQKMPPEGSFTGSTRTSQQKDDLTHWFSKPYPLELTDDLGNKWVILVKSVEWERMRRTNTQFNYRYSVTFWSIE